MDNYRNSNISKESKINIKNKIKNIENKSGIYFLYKDSKIVYIGQSIRLKRRVQNHLSIGIKDFDDCSVEYLPEERLLEEERKLINFYSPKYNGGLLETYSQKRDQVYQLRLTLEEKETLELAANLGKTLMSRVIREGALKEAKKILKEIEKGK